MLVTQILIRKESLFKVDNDRNAYAILMTKALTSEEIPSPSI